jgi:hypothetical protein
VNFTSERKPGESGYFCAWVNRGRESRSQGQLFKIRIMSAFVVEGVFSGRLDFLVRGRLVGGLKPRGLADPEGGEQTPFPPTSRSNTNLWFTVSSSEAIGGFHPQRSVKKLKLNLQGMAPDTEGAVISLFALAGRGLGVDCRR